MPIFAEFQNMMIYLIQFKVNFVFGLFLKFIEVYDFFVNYLVFVLLVELYDGDAKIIRIQVNTNYSIFKEILELLFPFYIHFIIYQVDDIILYSYRDRSSLFLHEKLNLVQQPPLFVRKSLVNNQIIIFITRTLVYELVEFDIQLKQPISLLI